MQGDYCFLPVEHVIFGAGSLERLPGELERLKVRRALIITGQSLATKTGIVRKVEETLGAAHAGTFSAIRQHTPDALIGFRGLMLQRGPRIVTHFEGH
jgi:alcohol dehydrogenase class IV